MLYLLRLFAAFGRGEAPAPDWAGSWAAQAVDEAQWLALQRDLREAYAELVAHRSARSAWPDAAIAAAMMLLAHCAYHVGEIRQRIVWVV